MSIMKIIMAIISIIMASKIISVMAMAMASNEK
jgi:hypothetical protein